MILKNFVRVLNWQVFRCLTTRRLQDVNPPLPPSHITLIID